MAIGDLKSGFMPCTPYGCIELIKRYFLWKVLPNQTEFRT